VTVFAAAVDDLFADANLAVEASYSPASGGAALVVGVILREPDHTAELLQTGAVVASLIAEVRASELAQPEEGGQLSIGADVYVVRSVDSDALALIWRLSLAPA
jgi:hypothetical protein